MWLLLPPRVKQHWRVILLQNLRLMPVVINFRLFLVEYIITLGGVSVIIGLAMMRLTLV